MSYPLTPQFRPAIPRVHGNHSPSPRDGRNSHQQNSPFSKAVAVVLGVVVGAVTTYLSLYKDLGGFQITKEIQTKWLSRSPLTDIQFPDAGVYGKNKTIPAGRSWSVTTPPSDLRNKQDRNESCSERKQFAFVKVHKAGSTTPYAIFQRFGFKRHLHFVLPSNERVDVGWPYLMKREDYLPPIPGRPFDLLVDHAVYNRQIFRSLMPNNTVYLAIIREPYSHLKSVLNWYAVVRKYGLKKDQPVASLLKNPEGLDRRWLVPREHKQPFSWTRNFMAYDLGLPVALANDEQYVRDYIAQLDRDFLLVLVLEYFDESLVLMKRYMCWQLRDILYKVRNTREYGFKTDNLSPKMKKVHRNWSKADYLIYEHFNRTLWDNIAREGDGFFDEVARFKQVNEMVTRFCDVTVVNNNTAAKPFGATPWNQEFVIDRKFCKLLDVRFRYPLQRIHIQKLRKEGVNIPWPGWLGEPPKPPAKSPPKPPAKPTKIKRSKAQPKTSRKGHR